MKKFLIALFSILAFLQFGIASVGLFLPFEHGIKLIVFNLPFVFLWLYNIKLIFEEL